MEAYTAAKAQIVNHQRPTDWAVLNADDPGSAGLRPKGQVIRFSLNRAVEGAYLDGNALVLGRDGQREVICERRDLKLPGLHNVANVLTACSIGSAAGIGVEAMRIACVDFTGVAHRLELVAEVDGVRYINDSIATAPERSMAALAALRGTPVVLLAGGRDKHLPMEEWAHMMVETTRALVLFGEMAPLIEGAASEAGMPPERVHQAGTVSAGVRLARRLAQSGDAVVLSPGGTSYDQYQDFEERGADFRASVAALSAVTSGGRA
jgi:UDP-N-acetylmuramoylalanine--D-glutamate ligase